ncbi:MAG: glycosyltransferase [Chroococcidiopsidaceae cyanobacterium CP_BM_RX_35]|nr:glycosyltransferase [Chroococcidiopsidaceae cyanobacterium CP_BM_RX_35]
MKPIAIVAPWFGKDLKGGAEQHAWQVATRLADRGYPVEVLTTCCCSFHEDWALNHLPSGLVQEQNLKILRFPVDYRKQHDFDRINGLMLNLPASALKVEVNPVSSEDEAIFCSENINSADLLSSLKNQQEKYHAFIFIPYLYGPILNGLTLVANKAFLLPCLHDEVYAYLPRVANIFHKAKGLLFISDGEAQLARQLYGPGIIPKSTVVGAGVEVSRGDNEAINQIGKIGNFRVKQERFVLCLGRRDPGKNTNLLVDVYAGFRYKHPDSNLKLVLAGPGSISFNDAVPGVVDLGLVEENEKEALLANCLALFQPSRNESYSRVMMEAWLYKRPVAAHRDCLATAIAVEQAQGGWVAGTETEWQELFSTIDDMEEAKLAQYGSNGQRYAEANATWNKVIERYEAALELSVEGVRVLPEPQQETKLKEMHQLLPNLSYGDAISNHALTIRNYLRSCNYKSDIFVRYIDERLNHEAQVFQPNTIDRQAGLFYHHSIGSELTEHAIKHPGPKCLIYHNITPAEFFQPYRPEFAKILEKGRAELNQLASPFSISVGDSAYNAAELAASGFYQPGVLPITVDPMKWDIAADASWMKQLQDGKSNLLFVGRLSPNKRQDHLLEAFAHYLTMDRNARLIIVGSHETKNPYWTHIVNTTRKLGLTGHVIVTGQVNDSQLLAFYRTAHLFWSMSEHEGFCVPLVESMWFDIPVLAYKSSAVPETMGEAGIIFTSKDDFIKVAALAKLLVKDKDLRLKVIEAQRKRRERFLPTVVVEQLRRVVSRMEAGCEL